MYPTEAGKLGKVCVLAPAQLVSMAPKFGWVKGAGRGTVLA
jgi:hypothetical protein